MSHAAHSPVMLEQALDGLAIDPGGIYVDATFGRGGHSTAILDRLDADGRLYALDRDPQAVAAATLLARDDPRLTALQAGFGELVQIAAQCRITGLVNGLLVDLGVSSPQLDDPRRGFSFQADGPLDMRMDPASHPSAADWLARADEADIAQVLKTLGEERFARRIARAIVTARRERPLTRTRALAELVAAAVPTREPGKHPATRTFQAIRLHINQELEQLQSLLAATLDVLARGARLVVISFHSLEDRIVKRFMRDTARGPQLPRGVPVTASQAQGRMRVVGKAQRPDAAEIERNPRARSAVLRIAEVVA